MNTAEAAWSLLNVDQEIAEDLRVLGVASAEDLDQTRRDALASALMRKMAETSHELEQLEASLKAEVAVITARYDAGIKRHATRYSELTIAVQAIAIHTKEAGGYVGKKKSRDVGAGTYGYKSYAAGFALRDEAAYIAWAEQNAPETLRVKPTMTLATAREYLTELELAGVKREVMKSDVTKLIATDPDTLPPGYEKTPADDEYYAKPLPLVAIAPTSTATKAA